MAAQMVYRMRETWRDGVMRIWKLNPFRWRRAQAKTSLPGFDPDYYLHWYPDVGEAGLNPLKHYFQRGWKGGRDPSAGFSTTGYLSANPDVATAGCNPLLHFLSRGFAEGRSGFAKDQRSTVTFPNRQYGSKFFGDRTVHKKLMNSFAGEACPQIGFRGGSII